MDRILMEGMAFFGRHGVFTAERELGARFTVDVELQGDLREAGRSDHLEDTIDYVRAYEVVRHVVEGPPCHLLEAVAERIASRLLELPRVERATVRVRKRPPLEGEFRAFGVEVVRALSSLAYFDCFSGISGDMALGALLDAGGELETLKTAAQHLGLGDEVGIEVRHEHRGHLAGSRVVVECGPGPSRTLTDLLKVVEGAQLPPRVRERSLAALARLGQAESHVHRTPESELHLHELGGADTLVDLVGTFWLLESLGVDQVYASPLPAPSGIRRELPLTAPATLQVLAGSGAILRPDARAWELVTPTGAAILTAVASFQRPALRIASVGIGLGARPEPGNGLAVWLGEPASEPAEVVLVETNLDDMPPNRLAALVEDLLEAGALDVTVTPVLMKKGRPGHVLSAMSSPAEARGLARMLLEGSTTFGVRLASAERLTSDRRSLEVKTEWGSVRVKVKALPGNASQVSAEYEDARGVSRQAGVPLERVMRQAEARARAELGLE